MRRRTALRALAFGASASLAGCFGIAHRLPPDHGEIDVRNSDDEAHTVRLQLVDGERVELDETYDLGPDESGPTETVEPAEYVVEATLDGELTREFEWPITNCRSGAYLDVWDADEGTDERALGFGTSAC